MPTLAYPKPAPRAVRRLAEKRHKEASRKRCRLLVLARDGYRCRACNAYLGSRGSVHEIVPRSRGGSPFEPANCVTLCEPHHQDVQQHRSEIIIMTPEGANGLLLFTPREETTTCQER